MFQEGKVALRNSALFKKLYQSTNFETTTVNNLPLSKYKMIGIYHQNGDGYKMTMCHKEANKLSLNAYGNQEYNFQGFLEINWDAGSISVTKKQGIGWNTNAFCLLSIYGLFEDN